MGVVKGAWVGWRGEEGRGGKGVGEWCICEFFEGGIGGGEKDCIGYAGEECECVLCTIFDGTVEGERGRGGNMGAGG